MNGNEVASRGQESEGTPYKRAAAECDSRIESAGEANRAAVLKQVGSAIFLLYALGWGLTLGWQDGWAANMRATYGYQLGCLTSLITCAAAVLYHRFTRSAVPREPGVGTAPSALDGQVFGTNAEDA